MQNKDTLMVWLYGMVNAYIKVITNNSINIGVDIVIKNKIIIIIIVNNMSGTLM